MARDDHEVTAFVETQPQILDANQVAVLSIGTSFEQTLESNAAAARGKCSVGAEVCRLVLEQVDVDGGVMLTARCADCANPALPVDTVKRVLGVAGQRLRAVQRTQPDLPIGDALRNPSTPFILSLAATEQEPARRLISVEALATLAPSSTRMPSMIFSSVNHTLIVRTSNRSMQSDPEQRYVGIFLRSETAQSAVRSHSSLFMNVDHPELGAFLRDADFLLSCRGVGDECVALLAQAHERLVAEGVIASQDSVS